MTRAKSWLRTFCLFAACLSASQVSVAQVTVPGTMIRNVANVDYQGPGAVATTTLSNEVSLAVQPLPSRASIRIARFDSGSQTTSTAGPTQCRQGGSFVDLVAPAPQGRGVLDPTAPLPLSDTSIAHAGDPVFVRVMDLDRNRDGSVVETVDVQVTARATAFGNRTEYRRIRRLYPYLGCDRCAGLCARSPAQF
jgi:hypothetical protein